MTIHVSDYRVMGRDDRKLVESYFDPDVGHVWQPKSVAQHEPHVDDTNAANVKWLDPHVTLCLVHNVHCGERSNSSGLVACHRKGRCRSGDAFDWIKPKLIQSLEIDWIGRYSHELHLFLERWRLSSLSLDPFVSASQCICSWKKRCGLRCVHGRGERCHNP